MKLFRLIQDMRQAREAREILARSLDREYDPTESLKTLAIVAVNGLYWREVSLRKYQDWMHSETGTIDIHEASEQLKKWRIASRMFDSIYDSTN